MKIHFVCSGNTNRSRMAEAYLKSQQISGLDISSSGIYATHNENGPLSKYAETVLTENNIIKFAAHTWTQTTKHLLEAADLVIFMSNHQFEYCRDELGVIPKKYLIWNIGDVETNPQGDDDAARRRKILEDEDIFEQIKKRVDDLIENLN